LGWRSSGIEVKFQSKMQQTWQLNEEIEKKERRRGRRGPRAESYGLQDVAQGSDFNIWVKEILNHQSRGKSISTRALAGGEKGKREGTSKMANEVFQKRAETRAIGKLSREGS